MGVPVREGAFILPREIDVPKGFFLKNCKNLQANKSFSYPFAYDQ